MSYVRFSGAVPLRTNLLVAVVLGAHVILLAVSAAWHSPCWDEVGHLPAGVSHWVTGRFDLYRVNPPLTRAIAALPVVLTESTKPWLAESWLNYTHDTRGRPEFGLGHRAIKTRGIAAFYSFVFARWMVIPLSVFGGLICYRWANELYGQVSGLLALALWCFSPNILAHGQLITPDVGATSLGLASMFAFWHWLREPGWPRALLAGLVLGLAELTKFTWVVFFGLWPLLWLIVRLARRRCWAAPGHVRLEARSASERAACEQTHSLARRACISGRSRQTRRGPSTTPIGAWHRESGQLAVMFLLAVHVINVGYAFEGSFRPLKRFTFLSSTLASSGGHTMETAEPGNRFRKSWMGHIPVPLPANYVLGIDRQKVDFEEGYPSYLRGEWKHGGWWYYYLYALAVKVPLGTWVLALLAFGVSLFGRGYATPWGDEVMMIAPIVVVLVLVSSQTGFNHHMRYVLPVFPFAFIWMSKVARAVEFGHRKLVVGVAGALLWSVGSSLYHYPHSLSYFNELVGGPKNGHRHLLESNTDWGQDLLLFKRWLERHPETHPIGLAYSLPRHLLDPVDIGIEYTLPPPGPGRDHSADTSSAAQFGPHPGWYAIFVRSLHERHRRYTYFEPFEPVEMIGYTVRIYHITVEDANRVRRQMGLPEVQESKGTRAEASPS